MDYKLTLRTIGLTGFTEKQKHEVRLELFTILQDYNIHNIILLLVNFSYISRRETMDSREGFLLEAGIGRNLEAGIGRNLEAGIGRSDQSQW